jgi:Fe-S cluster assembly protein SufD
VSASTGSSALAASFVEAYRAASDSRGERDGLATLREQAIGSFAEQGLPHRKLEDWRYTSLAGILRQEWSTAEARTPTEAEIEAVRAHLASITLPEIEAARVVFLDGSFCNELSTLPLDDDAVSIHSLATASSIGDDRAGAELLGEAYGQLADSKLDAFTALNTAFAHDGAVIEISAEGTARNPIHILFVTRRAGQLQCPRVLVVARRHSRATLIQDHISLGSGPRLSSSVSELVLEDGASLDWVTVQREERESIAIANLQARQGRESRLATHTFCLGGALIRNQLGALLVDPGAEVDLRGLFIGAGSGHVENHTLVDHALPHTTSNEIYKGILGDASRGVFRGRVVVRPDAQVTRAGQSNSNLLLTDHAEIDTKPQLEIYADDVKCSHGATVGQLDDDALFYLRARGLSEHDACMMLTTGFANEICDALPGGALASWARRLVASSLETVQAASGGGPV